ncbi:RNA-dependent RNA polymerase [Azolla filiculoides mitovirus 1]|uniref:RNA-dependent RNA polymerase n=1 Tax=Azolla filiculoides mitovirus 1 TaxID=2080457 RepID=A0ABM9WIE3_9VIRU|nr:RNA-dependent RNA polymerase [Azolla filiculoides mitovirus 1]DAB41741.1 TPA_inf: RNA-dependent RNA polymerase [Azolla filiculoides mitovirus 1]
MENKFINTFSTINLPSRCGPWRWLFEKPETLTAYLRYQLWVVHGYRSKEMALLAVYMARKISAMYKNQGPLHMALYLKQCRVSTMRAFGKNRDLRGMEISVSYTPSKKAPLVSLTRDGYPRLLLKRHRSMLRKGQESPKILRSYNTIFNIYKLVVIPQVVSIEPIMRLLGPSVDLLPKGPMNSPLLWLERVIPRICQVPLVCGLTPYMSWSASSTSPTGYGASVSIPVDARVLQNARLSEVFEASAVDAWFKNLFPGKKIPYQARDLVAAGALFHCSDVYWPGVYARTESDVTWVRAQSARSKKKVQETVAFIQAISDIPSRFKVKREIMDLGKVRPLYLDSGYRVPSLGRVSFKDEPAGKTRPFMICPLIVQWWLTPLHEWGFTVLSLVPQDGTFDQLKPLFKLMGRKHMICFDLTEATNRTPVRYIFHMLSRIFGKEVARSFMYLLGAEYQIPDALKPRVKEKASTIIFSTGMPLGAKSTWGLFTLFHHIMVQCAAYAVYKTVRWFPHYAILGDDLVISSVPVAREYRKLVERLGVEISLSKSLVSLDGTLEFASRYFTKGVDVSPLSFKLVNDAHASMSQGASLFLRLKQFREIRKSELYRFYGAGYRTLGKIDVPYGKLHRLPRKWQRAFLIFHHPHSKLHPIPWLWWLSAGRKSLIPPEVLGAASAILEDRFVRRTQEIFIEMERSMDFDYIGSEALVYGPWLDMHLRAQAKVWNLVMEGDLFAYLSYEPPPTNLRRVDPLQRGEKLFNKKVGKMLKLYDLVSHLIEKGPPRLFPVGDVATTCQSGQISY